MIQSIRTISFAGTFLVCMSLIAQDADTTFASLSFSSGFAQYGNTDRYITRTRYTGSFSPVSFQWNRFKAGKGFHLGLEIVDFSDLENGDIPNLSASILDFRLSANHYYKISSFDLLGRRAQLYIGPGYGVHAYERKQNVAQGGRLENLVSSYIIQFPLRINGRLYLPLNDRWNIVGESSISLVTVALRSDLDDEFDAHVLATNRNFQGLVDLTVNYAVLDRIHLFAAFKNRLVRISGTDQDLYMGQTGGEIGATIDLAKRQ